jgi:eukaryotic-like serine/threonine-protein kinase
MAITPGTRIGAYEVTSQLGEGGMGVVYRARDTKLLRDAALKVLPEHFADDPNRLSMLQREAQLLASLNHPNIAQIYGLEQVGNTGCIVMELVEGETLADKLKNGPLPFDEAMEIAKQIADALASAHEKGIVHRDLKPANIKLTPSGTVKVLDFGLAKVLSSPTQKTDLSMMPTKVSGSVAGGIVGTVGYMSPEQARGREVDARTDIWAFGCVLYEMLTARLAFEAETATDMIAKIVTADPDLNLLPPNTPPSIRLLLAATLNKNVNQRLQHIGDMRLFLDQKMFAGVANERAAVVHDKPAPSRVLVALLAVAVIAALSLAVLYFRTPAAAPPSEMRFELGLPENTNGGTLSLSPDGQRVVYATTTDGTRSLWIRSIGSETAQKLTGTENVQGGGWSPDGQRLAFVADGKLKKVDLSSGAVQVICDLPSGQTRGLTWNRDGVILFARSDNVIVRVSDTGGEIKPVTAPDKDKKEVALALPVFLPDGNHFLYAAVSSIQENIAIYVGSLDGQVKKRLLPFSRLEGLAYAPQGYLILSNGAVTVQRFDPKSLTLSGQPIALADGALLSVSDNGVLVYRKPLPPPAARQLTWFDRSGKQIGQLGASGNYGDVQISPKGDRVALDATDPNAPRDVWVMDVERAVLSRVTTETTDDWNPAWSPDGTRLIFASAGGKGTHIHVKSYTGAGSEDTVFEGPNEIPTDWSPNGRYIPFSRQKDGGGVDLWVLDTTEKKASPFIESRFDKAQSKISPDGRWIAFTTNDSGTYQIVVQSFPDPTGGKWQITSKGGIEPKWSHDGRELYYLDLDGKLTAVSIKGDKSIEAGKPESLFQTPLTVPRGGLPRTHRYDVAPDGKFLIAVPKATATNAPIVAVMNWTAGVEKKHE